MKLKTELAQIIRNSDFFVLFSNYETFGCVLTESLASGIPVIATNVGGMSNYISKEMGIIIEPRSEESLKDAILKMLDSSYTYDASLLSKYAQDNFSYNKVGLQFQEIYNKVLKKHAD